MAPNTILIGSLARETIINNQNKTFIDFLGGSLLYSAYGALIAGCRCGLVAKVGENYPSDWIRDICLNGIDIEGITRLPEDIDHRRFYRVLKNGRIENDHPQSHFLEIEQPLPKSLLGYSSFKDYSPLIKKIQSTSVTPSDLPDDYKKAKNVYISAIDYASLSLLPAYFRSFSEPNLFFNLSSSFLKPSLLDELSSIIQSAKIIFTGEKGLRNIIYGRKGSAIEAAEILCGFGAEMIIYLTSGNQIQIHFHEGNSNISVPVFTSEIKDPVGGFDAFIGGFIGKYIQCFDPISAVSVGSAIMGVKLQGTSPAFLLDTMPELVQARAQQVLNGIIST